MSISLITNSSPSSNPVVQEGAVESSPQQRPAQLPATDAQDTGDTVQLSQLAQVQQMAQQGESASAIASATGLPVSEVDSDLGITATSSSVPVAVPSGHVGGHPTAPAPAPAAAAVGPVATGAPKAATPTPTLSVRA